MIGGDDRSEMERRIEALEARVKVLESHEFEKRAVKAVETARRYGITSDCGLRVISLRGQNVPTDTEAKIRSAIGDYNKKSSSAATD